MRARTLKRPPSKFRRWVAGIATSLRRLWSDLNNEVNLAASIFLFIVCVSVALAWRKFLPDVFPDVWVEFIGLTLDVLFILIVFSIFEYQRHKRLHIQRQQEIIDDFKKWNSDEAKFRIAGAIRRLVQAGKTAINFSGIELKNFSFREHDIRTIRGSTFYDGTWGEMGSRDNVILEAVDFSHVDCRGVTFSPRDPFSGLGVNWASATYRNCMFIECDLRDAKFNGATIEWTIEHPEELGDQEEGFHGELMFNQTHYPPFHGTSLTGASFDNCRFINTDFRDVEDIHVCSFKGARGLETCLFDDEERKAEVIRRASIKDD